MRYALRIELHPVNQRVQAHEDGKLLTISKTTTYCPFKGHTVYFSQDIA
ncbi:hypothetical protein [Halomonas sp.]